MSPDHGFLYLDRFTCIREKEGPFGRDSPYFLVFVGHAQAAEGCDLVRVRHPDWQRAIESGDTCVAGIWVHHAVHGTSTVVAALLEQDWQCDIDDATLDALRRDMAAHWAHCLESSARVDDRADKVRALLAASVTRALGNDHLIGAAVLPITTDHGVLPAVTVTGEGAQYRLRFRVRAIAAKAEA